MRAKTFVVISSLLGILLASNLLNSQAQQAITPMNEQRAFLEDEQNTIDIVKHYGPSVVAITVEAPAQNGVNLDDMMQQVPEQFRRFFQIPENMPQEPVQGSGSGFVIDDEGHIITNFHVVEETLEANSVDFIEGASITVNFPGHDDEELPVKVVGVNPSFDLALLVLENLEDLPSELAAIPLADSDQVQVGQKVIAIGNPFGFSSTVTTGIVSGLNRDQIPTIGNYGNASFIQTDAAINPGNSGGSL
ncbi:MAG: trypsin-like peptidase domain-containing protein [Deinococcales bacterium]